MGLYIIVDEGLLGIASIPEVLEKAIQGGANAVQLRAKRLSKREYYSTAVSLLPISREAGIPFFVNDHLDIALAISADGIHLGQNDLPCRQARKIVPCGMMLGVSTHAIEQAEKAVTDGADYIAIGPVFPTTTKENPDEVVGTKMVATVREIIGNLPLVAIGGITAGNAAEVIQSGADSVAIASAVVLAGDPYEAAKELKATIQAARNSLT